MYCRQNAGNAAPHATGRGCNLNFGASDLALYKRIPPQNSTPFYDRYFKNTKHSWTPTPATLTARLKAFSFG